MSVSSSNTPPEPARALTTVLRLIDENASDQALDDALTSAGTDPETARLARRIALRARQAERSQGLVKILYDTATDLSSLRDVDAVLRAMDDFRILYADAKKALVEKFNQNAA